MKASNRISDWTLNPDDPVFRKQVEIIRRQKKIHRELANIVREIKPKKKYNIPF